MALKMLPAHTAGQGGSICGLEASWRALLDAGINDWGGVSPLTRDYVNPERPWPHVQSLAAATAATGKVLLPRQVPFAAVTRMVPSVDQAMDLLVDWEM